VGSHHPGLREEPDCRGARYARNNLLADALRQAGNRLAGILHGCLRARTLYDEANAWAHHAL
jgi:hypothetical protein